MGLRISEKCRCVIRSIFLGRSDSCWLLDIVEELLTAKGSLVFWKYSRAGFLVSFVPIWTNASWWWRNMVEVEGGDLS